jgi:murein DD-endopeptidase MepM/ murein hydrolase activator NlpD
MTAALIAGVGVAGLSAATAGAHTAVGTVDPLDLQAHARTPVAPDLPTPSPTGLLPATADLLAGGAPSPALSPAAIAAQRFTAATRAAAPVKATTRPVPKPSWVNPMPQATVTSCYGPRWGRLHAGVDLAAPSGTPILAVGAGTVVSAGDNHGGYGISVLIDHHNGYLTHYAHMSATAMKPGDVVRAGQHIGDEGSTGHSTGPHLHFEVHQGVWKNTVEPVAWLAAHGVTLPGCAAATTP